MMVNDNICNTCNVEIVWEGQHPINGVMWECECCNELVCSKCIEDSTGKPVDLDGEILCPVCIQKKNREVAH